MRLDGKKVLITGGTSGIGRSIAEAFAHEGACVAISGQNTERGHQVVREITKAGGDASFIKADIASVDQVRYLAQAAMDALGSVLLLAGGLGEVVGAQNKGCAPLRSWPSAFSTRGRSIFPEDGPCQRGEKRTCR